MTIVRAWKYFRVAYEGDGGAEPSFHATAIRACRFVAKPAMEQIYTLQGFFHGLVEGTYICHEL